MRIHLGTSGWQYPEWKGGFYPEQISAPKMLPYYAERFNSTEVNYTFRHLPSAKSVANWFAQTPENFTFSFKASQRITHFAKLVDCREHVRVLHAALEPLGEKLGPMLFQLPPTFGKDLPRLQKFLGELPKGLRAAFEFRHASWFDDEVFKVLRARGAALCLAEDEELTTPRLATASFGYLRLRQPEYPKRALEELAKFLREQTGWTDAFIYFKHEETGTGPRFAAQLAMML